jgi:uncharacterized protein (DUF2267 family)
VKYEDWIDEVARRAGMTERADAERTLEVTLRALRSGLDDADALAIAAVLPRRFARILERGVFEAELDEAALDERVRRREHVSPGFAREHAQVVCQLLAERLSGDVLASLHRRTPVTSRLFEARPEPPEAPPHVRRHPSSRAAPRRTLAAGRPGAARPVSEGSAEAAHSGSVARTGSPHEGSKLSSSRGTTQERADETFSAGSPPEPARPLYRAR